MISDVPTALEAQAIALREYFLALRSAGFTEDEALTLLSKVVRRDQRS